MTVRKPVWTRNLSRFMCWRSSSEKFDPVLLLASIDGLAASCQLGQYLAAVLRLQSRGCLLPLLLFKGCIHSPSLFIGQDAVMVLALSRVLAASLQTPPILSPVSLSPFLCLFCHPPAQLGQNATHYFKICITSFLTASYSCYPEQESEINLCSDVADLVSSHRFHAPSWWQQFAAPLLWCPTPFNPTTSESA